MDYNEFLDEIDKNNCLSETLKDNIRSLYEDYNNVISEKDKLIKENDKHQKIIRNILRNKIGQKIYWAHEQWTKIETHTITNVKYRKYNDDFFEEYKDKWCVLIEVDNSGFYVADDIGKTLFFDKEEALRHAKSVE